MKPLTEDKNILYFLFGLATTLFCVLYLIWALREGGTLLPASFLTVSIPLMLNGLFSEPVSDADRDTSEKDRDIAMILSFVPPCGHRYLGDWKKGIPMAVPFAVSIALFVAGAILAISASGETAGVASSILYCVITLTFSWLWSAISVNEMCNRMDIKREGCFFEMNIVRTKPVLIILFLTYAALYVLCTAFLMHEGYL